MTCFYFIHQKDMNQLIDEERSKNIITFLKNLQIESKRFIDILNENNEEIIYIIDEALTHSSANKNFNHEKLEFFGDAVLRLSATEFIEKKFQNMLVGQRSVLRAQLVSDEWLTKLGKKIHIEEIIIIGPKAMGDNFSKDTIIAETVEALIGAIYKCFNSTDEINLWLDKYWLEDSKLILKEPYKFNAKTTLQEWCQQKGYELPDYQLKEISKIHGDSKRFYCKLYINGTIQSTSYGKSHKIAEKNAAKIAIEKLLVN